MRLAGMAVDEGERTGEKLSKDRRPKTDHFGMFPCTKKKNVNFTEIARNSSPIFQDHQKRATTGPIRSTFQVVKSGPLEIAESIMQSSSGTWRLGNRETSLLPTDEPEGEINLRSNLPQSHPIKIQACRDVSSSPPSLSRKNNTQ